MIEMLSTMFSYQFMVRALIVGLLVSLCAALLGVSLVLKRYSMIGDGLSHVGFGALAVATALGMAPMAVTIPVVVAAAFLLLRLSSTGRLKGDAAIAMISTGALAVGVIVLSLSTGMTSDVNNYLFGSMLAMSREDVTLSVVLAAAVLMLFVLFYRRIFAVTFDETFARATGGHAEACNMLLALLTAVTIVLGMRVMGTMLISSLIIFPALTAMRVGRSFKSVTLCSRGGIGGMLLCGAVRKLPAFHRRRSHGGRGQHSGVPDLCRRRAASRVMSQQKGFRTLRQGPEAFFVHRSGRGQVQKRGHHAREALCLLAGGHFAEDADARFRTAEACDKPAIVKEHLAAVHVVHALHRHGEIRQLFIHHEKRIQPLLRFLIEGPVALGHVGGAEFVVDFPHQGAHLLAGHAEHLHQ